MIARLYSLNKQFIYLNGKLLALPKLTKAFIMDALGYGWDRNRAIDSKGNHNNALMGGYLLAASNTVIAITGILTTDTIAPLTSGGNVGTVTVNGTISFALGIKYGAFEVYRGTTRIGRYCLTERQGLRIINQVTGGLPNGLLGGTTTTVWQRSNAFYSETNERGYSISGTGWVTSAGAALTVGTIIPADTLNPAKCMAWIGGVQQDLQFIGKARNNVSLLNRVFKYHNNSYHKLRAFPAVTVTSHIAEGWFMCSQGVDSVADIAGSGAYSDAKLHGLFKNGIYLTYKVVSGVSYAAIDLNATNLFNVPLYAKGEYSGSAGTFTLTVIALTTGAVYTHTVTGKPASLNILTGDLYVGGGTTLTSARSRITVNGALYDDYMPSPVDNSIISLKYGVEYAATGVTADLVQYTDLVHNALNSTGYEIWKLGLDYRVYPLSVTGTRIITPAGYTLVETVTAGNMPSVADSRMSTFKYALANSYAVRQSVPEAFDTTDPCAPKLLTYPELSVLSNNDKVYITESNGKITNIKAT